MPISLYPLRSIPDGEPNLRRIDLQLASLQTFKDQVVDMVAGKEIQLKRARNAASPIHRLPPEILINIFLKTFGEQEYWNSIQLRKLVRVSKAWFDIVKSNSVFWQQLSSEDSQSFQKQSLRNNVTGPIQLICANYHAHKNNQILGIALSYSCRWKSVLFTGGIPTSFPSCLSVTTPRLTDLYVYNNSKERLHHRIELSEGRNLRDVDVEGVSLEWGAGRLTRLRALSIRGLSRDIPTLSQLYSMLCSSPELWCLCLSELTDSQQEPGDDYSCIQLPNLSKLFLQKIPSQMTDFLLSHIDSPNPMRLDIDDAFALPASRLLQETLGLTLSTAKEITLHYDGLIGSLSIMTMPEEYIRNQRVYMIDDQPGCSVLLPRQPLAEYWELSVQWIATASPPPAIKLSISSGDRNSPPAIHFDFPVELLRSLTSLHALHICQTYNPAAIFEFLAARPEGEDPWTCPKLTGISVEYSQTSTYLDNLITTVEQRRNNDRTEKLATVRARRAVTQAVKKTKGWETIIYEVVD